MTMRKRFREVDTKQLVESHPLSAGRAFLDPVGGEAWVEFSVAPIEAHEPGAEKEWREVFDAAEKLAKKLGSSGTPVVEEASGAFATHKISLGFNL